MSAEREPLKPEETHARLRAICWSKWLRQFVIVGITADKPVSGDDMLAYVNRVEKLEQLAIAAAALRPFIDPDTEEYHRNKVGQFEFTLDNLNGVEFSAPAAEVSA